ncbi:MAG: hypothetical protein QXG00_00835 [Candidatus Woesearchaeota archaeon]
MNYKTSEKISTKSKCLLLVAAMLILFTFNFVSAVSLVSPVNESWKNTTEVIFTFILSEQDLINTSEISMIINLSGNGSSNQTREEILNVSELLNQTRCTLKIDNANITTTISVLGQNSIFANLSDGAHNWKIKCELSESEIRVINIDTIPPFISLLSPLNNSILEVSGITLNTDFVFVSEDNSPIQQCNIYLYSNFINITESLNYTQTPQIHKVNNMLLGNYSWKVRCKDYVGNMRTSDIFNFNIDQVQNPNFDITFSKQTLNIGEEGNMIINANPSALVQYLQITPPRGTAYILPPISTFPYIQKLPQTNYTGIYNVFGIMIYRNQFYNISKQYEIANNMQIHISGLRDINASETITLNMTASGGIAPYTYYWIEENSDHSRTNGQVFSKKYDSEGNFIINAVVQDSFGNNKTRLVTIDVNKYYNLTLIVKDTNNNPLEDVLVIVDDNANRTETHGKVSLLLKAGEYKITATKDGYLTNTTEINISSNKEIVLTLIKNDILKPLITLETSENASFAGEAMLIFSVSHNKKIDCTLLINQNELSFEKKSTISDVNTSKKQSFILNLPAGTYNWKIQCTDSSGIIGESSERTFFVSINSKTNEKFPIQSTIPTNDFADFLSMLENSLTSYEHYSKEQKEVAELFKFNTNINNAINAIERARIDIANINRMGALSDEQRLDKIREIKERIDSILKETLLDVQVSDTTAFIKYPENKNVEKILDEYYTAKNYKLNKNAFISANKKIQSKLLTTTKVYIVNLELFNNSKKITLVLRELKFDDASTYNVIEYIPKSLAESGSEITLVTAGTIVKDDPIIEYDNIGNNDNMGDNTDQNNKIFKIVYYYPKPIIVEEIKNSDTLIISQNIKNSAITGFSILSNINIRFKKIVYFLIPGIIIAVILLITLKIPQKVFQPSNQNFGNTKIFPLKSSTNEKLNLVIMINEAKDLISHGRIDDATKKYNAIHLHYTNSSEKIKKEFLNDILIVYSTIMTSMVNSLIDNCYSCLEKNMIEDAIKIYEQISQQYILLTDDLKNQYYARLSNLAEKINFHQLMYGKRHD